MARLAFPLFGVLLTIVVAAAPLTYHHYRHARCRNLRLVRDGVLLRCGQPTLAGLQGLVRDHGIRTVITLRDATVPGQPPPDQAEEDWCRSQGLNHVRISPARWYAEDGEAPAAAGVRQFLAVLDDPANHPVLLHCYAGVHRTGAFSAVFRMEYDRWTNAQAIAELRATGYSNLGDEWDLLEFLKTYRPRWKTD